MTKYHTEGTIKTIELVDNKPTVKLDPVSPYRFATKKYGKETIRILFKENEDELQPIIVFSNAGTETGIHIEIAESDGEERKSIPSLELSCVKPDDILTLQKPGNTNTSTTLAFLSDGDTKFSIKGGLDKQVDFASLLALKQNRTKIRIEVFFDPSKTAKPTQIENITICE